MAKKQEKRITSRASTALYAKEFLDWLERLFPFPKRWKITLEQFGILSITTIHPYLFRTTIESLAELAGVRDCHPHRLRHTFATKLVFEGMDSMLAKKLTRHKSESSFSRYTNRALELKAEKQFYRLCEQEPGEK